MRTLRFSCTIFAFLHRQTGNKDLKKVDRYLGWPWSIIERRCFRSQEVGLSFLPNFCALVNMYISFGAVWYIAGWKISLDQVSWMTSCNGWLTLCRANLSNMFPEGFWGYRSQQRVFFDWIISPARRFEIFHTSVVAWRQRLHIMRDTLLCNLLSN